MLTDHDSFFKEFIERPSEMAAELPFVKSTFLTYLDANHRAAIKLLDEALSNADSYERTFLAIPIISLVRHSIELALKTIIEQADDVLGTSSIENNLHHRVGDLWTETQKLLQEMGIKRDPEQMKLAKSLIVELQKYDPLSFSFRYPYDKKSGRASLDGVPRIDLANMRDVYLRLREFLMDLLTEAFHQPSYSEHFR